MLWDTHKLLIILEVVLNAISVIRKIYTAKYGKKQSEPNALDKLLDEVNDNKYIF